MFGGSTTLYPDLSGTNHPPTYSAPTFGGSGSKSKFNIKCPLPETWAKICFTIAIIVGAIVLGSSLCSHYGAFAKAGALSHLFPTIAKGLHLNQKTFEYIAMSKASLSIILASSGLYLLKRRARYIRLSPSTVISDT